MYGQMTAGSWIYIGTPGHRAGHLRDLRRGAAASTTAASLAGSWILTAGLGGMGGAQPLAATMAGASLLGDRMPASRASSCACDTGYLDAQAKRPRRGAGDASSARSREQEAGLGRPARQRRRGAARSWCGAACGPTSSPTRPRRTTRQRLPARRAGRWTQWEPTRATRPARASSSAAKQSMAAHVQAMLEFHAAGVPTFDYGNNIRQVALGRGRGRTRSTFPGFVPAYIRPLFCRGIGPVPLGRALGRPGGHLQDRRQGEGADSRTTRTCTAGSTWRASASASRACRRASAGSGLGDRAPRWASPSTRWCAAAS